MERSGYPYPSPIEVGCPVWVSGLGAVEARRDVRSPFSASPDWRFGAARVITRRMFEFRELPDVHDALAYSPLLGAARLTLGYLEAEGSIGLTKTKAFKRSFVAWAAERFEWPGYDADHLARFNRVLNEADIPPLELLHFLMLELKLARRYRDELRLTKRGAALARSPGALYRELIPFYVLQIDHASYGRLDDRPFGHWDVWLNVINVEVENGASERDLFTAFYGEPADMHGKSWREMAAFSHCVLTPLEWAGLLSRHEAKDGDGRRSRICFKTPLWRAALKLDTDDKLEPASRH